MTDAGAIHDGPMISEGTTDPEQRATGVGEVDEALTLLSGLDGRPVDEHPAVFEAVHGALRGALGGGA